METKELHITRRNGDKYVVLLDYDLYELAVSMGAWSIFPKPTVVHVGKKTPRGDNPRKCFLMHRWVMGFPPSGVDVDHINGNGLDNRRCNLRLATRSQNLANAAIPRHNSSGYKGVSATRNGKWLARIRKDRVQRNLGIFDTPEEAHAAYCEAAVSLYGEFANFGKHIK